MLCGVNMQASEWQVHGLLTWRWEADVFTLLRKKESLAFYVIGGCLDLAVFEFKAVRPVIGSF